MVFDLLGKFLRCFGKKGELPGDFNRPASVGICRGKVVVSEFSGRRMQVLDLDGTPLQLIPVLPRNWTAPPTARTLSYPAEANDELERKDRSSSGDVTEDSILPSANSGLVISGLLHDAGVARCVTHVGEDFPHVAANDHQSLRDPRTVLTDQRLEKHTGDDAAIDKGASVTSQQGCQAVGCASDHVAARLGPLFVDDEEGMVIVSAGAPAQQVLHVFQVVDRGGGGGNFCPF
mmetsp:Transcript_3931/g.12182  ORF Transcript_3931/g.12182 Transcript_3931/m.12182 type:complete len:233 (-) Transcript_3931:9-707(-)